MPTAVSSGTVTRYSPEPSVGLTDDQASQRVRDGLVNRSSTARTKSAGRIFQDNLCTLFNLVNVILAIAVILVGSYKNALFLGVVICNVAIGTIQELRAKRTVDRLSLLTACRTRVVRQGIVQELPMEAVVLDDVLLLSAGSQVAADAELLVGCCDVNESFVTGEPDAIHKQPGDRLFAGSFVVSGSCRVRADHVGDNTYIASISRGVKVLKGASSEIMRSLRQIIKGISIAIFPVGAILFYNQLGQNDIHQAVVHTAAALVGMIPSGLMLLTSSVLAVGVVRLSRHQVLVQELYCIEALARVDVLCLDKTGTLTEGRMAVSQVVLLDSSPISVPKPELTHALSALAAAFEDRNATLDALAREFPHPPDWVVTQAIPFSSQTKWSGCTFVGQGSYLLGAPEYLVAKPNEALRIALDTYSKDYRILLLAYTPTPLEGRHLPADLQPLALVLLLDQIRPEAADTLRYFAEQGVAIKVISGDSASTVAHIAKRTGIAGWADMVDATTLQTPEALVAAAERYTVFGRVTPTQKQELVRALKAQGHTVAMTGDGVNDVLALREADCSVAMAAGSDAARNVSHLVLLDSSFDAMPRVVAEGRRSINNIQRSASLYLVKTIYATILAVLFVFVQLPYPFMPIQLTLISVLTIGAPSFVLALEPNHERVRGSFLKNIMRNALPGAGTILCEIILAMIAAQLLHLPDDQYSTLCVLMAGYSGLLTLSHVCQPFDRLRMVLFALMSTAFVLAVVFLPGLFSIASLSWPAAFALFGMIVTAHLLFALFLRLIKKRQVR